MKKFENPEMDIFQLNTEVITTTGNENTGSGPEDPEN